MWSSRFGVEFTRSRPRRKNDQAWVEQKNGALVRHLVGYERCEGLAAAQILGRLYSAARLFANLFQPSFKLKHKERVGSKIKKTYYRPTHRKKPRAPRHWRTRADPFAEVESILDTWFEKDPDLTARIALNRLQELYPGRFPDGKLRTLQRRVQKWRLEAAQKLVFAEGEDAVLNFSSASTMAR